MPFNIKICDYSSQEIDINVWATYEDGCLHFSGQDLGTITEDTWGESDYKYWYSFDHENTRKLMAALQIDDNDFERAIVEYFSGVDGMRNLREFCMTNDISWGFNSYA